MSPESQALGKWRSLREGAMATLPLLLGVVPFGIICGAVCADAGMPVWAGSGLSVLVFAGASQLVIVQLLVESSSVGVAVMAALVVNLRMLMYSASLAPHLREASGGVRVLLAYLLTDQAFGTSINRFSSLGSRPVDKAMFYCGSGLMMWLPFNVSTLVGVYLGVLIPEELGLDFAIPLTFMALVAPRITDQPTLFAAVVAGVVAFMGQELPYNLGLMLAAVVGISVGLLGERKVARV